MFWGEPKIGLRGFRYGFRILSGIEIVILSMIVINVLIFEMKYVVLIQMGLWGIA